MNYFKPYGWLYGICGPTTKHLILEVYLVICLVLLTVSSLASLYKDELFSVTTWRMDVLFLALHAIWLSKYLLFRIVCIWDAASTTAATPSLRAWITLFITTHMTGGQWFDRGSSSSSSGSGGSHSSMQFLLSPKAKQGVGISSTPREESQYWKKYWVHKTTTTWNYPLQWWKVRCWIPLLRLLEQSERNNRQLNKRVLQQQQQTQPQQQQQSQVCEQERTQTPPLEKSARRKSSQSAVPRTTSPSTTTPSPNTATPSPPAIMPRSSDPLPSLVSRWFAFFHPISAAWGKGKRWMHSSRSGGSGSGGYWWWLYPLLVQYTTYLWTHGPTLQFLLPNILSFVALNSILWELRFFLWFLGGTNPLQQSPDPTAPSALYTAGFAVHQLKPEDARWISKRHGQYIVPTTTSNHHHYHDDEQNNISDHPFYSLFSWLALIVLCGLSVFMFSRIFPPIPDQVAGNNVAKDIRRDAAAHSSKAKSNDSFYYYWDGGGGGGGTNSSSNSGGGAKQHNNSNKHSTMFGNSSGSTNNLTNLSSVASSHSHSMSSSNNNNNNNNNSTTGDAAVPAVWTESYTPISTEPRLKVCISVLVWRMLDIWICCGWLPRSDWLARALGHAQPHRQLPHWLAQDLYPVGITQPLRPDVLQRQWEQQVQDPTWQSWSWHVWNLIILPFIILGVQMIYLNRTYISLSSYFATEWNLIGPVEPGDVPLVSPAAAALATTTTSHGGASMSSSSSHHHHHSSTTLTTWDWRKNYKKDDLVIHHGFLYQATLNQPEGRPVEPELRDLIDSTLHEVGPPGTSYTIVYGFAIQLTSTVFMVLWWLLAFFYKDRTPDGLLIAVAANLIASYALSSLGTTDCDELMRIHNAILGKPVAGADAAAATTTSTTPKASHRTATTVLHATTTQFS